MEIGGSLILTNGGSLKLISAPTNDLIDSYGLVADIAGDIDIAADSRVYLQSSVTNGGNPIVKCSNLLIRSGGGVFADGGGFAGGRDVIGMGVNGAYGGGGYGGRGGDYNASLPGGDPHGDLLRPDYSGTGGGSTDGRAEMVGGYGGGLVRIIASDRVCVDGVISANGIQCGRQYSSGGSGGAVLVDCHVLEGVGSLSADGGPVYAPGDGGGGGGGRIAVWYGDHYTVNTPPHRIISAEIPPDTFNGSTSVLGGTANYEAGEAGTVRFIEVLYPQGTFFSSF